YGTTDYEQWPSHRKYNAEDIKGPATKAERERGFVGVGARSEIERMGGLLSPALSSNGGEREEAGESLQVFGSEESDRQTERPGGPEIPFHYFVQYHLHRQLKE